MSEANVEIIRCHYEIRHGKGGKRREVAATAADVQPRPEPPGRARDLCAPAEK